MTNQTFSPFTGDTIEPTKTLVDALNAYYLEDSQDYHFVLHWMFQEVIAHKSLDLAPRQRFVALTLYSTLNEIFLSFRESYKQEQRQR